MTLHKNTYSDMQDARNTSFGSAFRARMNNLKISDILCSFTST